MKNSGLTFSVRPLGDCYGFSKTMVVVQKVRLTGDPGQVQEWVKAERTSPIKLRQVLETIEKIATINNEDEKIAKKLKDY